MKYVKNIGKINNLDMEMQNCVVQLIGAKKTVLNMVTAHKILFQLNNNRIDQNTHTCIHIFKCKVSINKLI